MPIPEPRCGMTGPAAAWTGTPPTLSPLTSQALPGNRHTGREMLRVAGSRQAELPGSPQPARRRCWPRRRLGRWAGWWWRAGTGPGGRLRCPRRTRRPGRSPRPPGPAGPGSARRRSPARSQTSSRQKAPTPRPSPRGTSSPARCPWNSADLPGAVSGFPCWLPRRQQRAQPVPVMERRRHRLIQHHHPGLMRQHLTHRRWGTGPGPAPRRRRVQAQPPGLDKPHPAANGLLTEYGQTRLPAWRRRRPASA